MWIQLTNAYCKVINAKPEEKEWLQSFLQFDDGKAQYRKGARQQISLYNAFADTFPSGLLSMVVREIRERAVSEPNSVAARIKPEIMDARKRPGDPLGDDEWDHSFLRDYQFEAVKLVHKRTRGILWHPTAAGKTQTAVGTVISLPSAKWLFLVNQADLVHQAKARYEKITGAKAGIIGDGELDFSDTFTAATFQTLFSRISKPGSKGYAEILAFLDSITGLIVDEAHTVAAGTFWRVISLLKNAYWRVGLSGTPLARTDKRSVLVLAAIGDIIQRILPQTLIDAGYLSLPSIKMIRLKQVVSEGANITYAQFRRKYIVDSRARNAAIVEAVDKVEKPALVFVREIKHGRILRKVLQQRGFNVEFVFGKDEVSRRQFLIKQLEQQKLDVIVCSNVFTTGVDIPSLAGGVNASGGKSPIETLQRLGRGLRVVDGKSTFDWYDIYDTGFKYLDEHTEERVDTYRAEGYEVLESNSTTGQHMANEAALQAKMDKALNKKGAKKLTEVDMSFDIGSLG